MIARLKAGSSAPIVRTGNCCGCNTYPVQLFQIPTLPDRFRCARCYALETGTPAPSPQSI